MAIWKYGVKEIGNKKQQVFNYYFTLEGIFAFMYRI